MKVRFKYLLFLDRKNIITVTIGYLSLHCPATGATLTSRTKRQYEKSNDYFI